MLCSYFVPSFILTCLLLLMPETTEKISVHKEYPKQGKMDVYSISTLSEDLIVTKDGIGHLSLCEDPKPDIALEESEEPLECSSTFYYCPSPW